MGFVFDSHSESGVPMPHKGVSDPIVLSLVSQNFPKDCFFDLSSSNLNVGQPRSSCRLADSDGMELLPW